jgi:hypothetical protein
MQRLLKYPLLLATLMASTPPSHPQRDVLSVALGNAQDLARHVNECKRDFDDMLWVEQIEASLKEFNPQGPGMQPLVTPPPSLLLPERPLIARLNTGAMSSMAI